MIDGATCQLRDATETAQDDARQAAPDVQSDTTVSRDARMARPLIRGWLREYPDIVNGRGPLADGSTIAELFENSMRRIPGNEGDSLEFWYGDDKTEGGDFESVLVVERADHERADQAV